MYHNCAPDIYRGVAQKQQAKESLRRREMVPTVHEREVCSFLSL